MKGYSSGSGGNSKMRLSPLKLLKHGGEDWERSRGVQRRSAGGMGSSGTFWNRDLFHYLLARVVAIRGAKEGRTMGRSDRVLSPGACLGSGYFWRLDNKCHGIGSKC